MTDAAPSVFVRLWLAISCALRVLFDPALARRVERAMLPEPDPVVPPPQTQVEVAAETEGDALGLLTLFQREGRLVDFLKQEIDAFGDAEIGSATRVVHSGCRKALLAHFEIVKIREEAEGATVTVPEGFDGHAVKLTGNVRGSAPYRGVLRHGGWRATSVRLPARVAGYDESIIAAAEVEL